MRVLVTESADFVGSHDVRHLDDGPAATDPWYVDDRSWWEPLTRRAALTRK